MDQIMKSLLPTAATLLAGPAAGFAVKFLADKLGVPEKTQEAVTNAIASMASNPDERIKLAQIDAELRVKAMDSGIELDRLAVSNAADVNKTMQAEAGSEHWPTYSWRPAIGFAVALAIALSVITVFLAYAAVVFYGKAEGLQHLPGILAAIAGVIGVASPILGIASWFRGRMQADPSIQTNNRG